jgi:ATP-binding cassette subfamily B (MDR/TAP) protein 1
MEEKEKELENKSKKTGTKTKSVPFYKLFTFSTKKEKCLIVWGTLNAVVHGVTLPLLTVFFGNVIQSFLLYDGSPSSADAMRTGIRDGCINMCVVAAVTFVSAYFQMSCWMISGEFQAKRIRRIFFESILKQEISWFDAHTTGELTNRYGGVNPETIFI